MKELICIVCPKGCHLQVEEGNGFSAMGQGDSIIGQGDSIIGQGDSIIGQGDLVVTGQGCSRGADYARAELTNPTRVITSTVCMRWPETVKDAPRRCPVKTDRPIPKDRIFEAMACLDSVILRPPVRVGQLVAENLYAVGAGEETANFIATRNFNMEAEHGAMK